MTWARGICISALCGTFGGGTYPGDGVTAALFKQNGIHVFNEFQIEDALDFLEGLEE